MRGFLVQLRNWTLQSIINKGLEHEVDHLAVAAAYGLGTYLPVGNPMEGQQEDGAECQYRILYKKVSADIVRDHIVPSSEKVDTMQNGFATLNGSVNDVAATLMKTSQQVPLSMQRGRKTHSLPLSDGLTGSQRFERRRRSRSSSKASATARQEDLAPVPLALAADAVPAQGRNLVNDGPVVPRGAGNSMPAAPTKLPPILEEDIRLEDSVHLDANPSVDVPPCPQVDAACEHSLPCTELQQEGSTRREIDLF